METPPDKTKFDLVKRFNDLVEIYLGSDEEEFSVEKLTELATILKSQIDEIFSFRERSIHESMTLVNTLSLIDNIKEYFSILMSLDEDQLSQVLDGREPNIQVHIVWQKQNISLLKEIYNSILNHFQERLGEKKL